MAAGSLGEIEEMIDAFGRFCGAFSDLGRAAEFHARIAEIDARSKGLNEAGLRSARDRMVRGPCRLFSEGEMARHILAKPYGYAGDFEVIDWIYGGRICDRSERGRFWDEFFHAQDAPRGVNWRRRHFADQLAAVLARRKEGAVLNILSIGSGPCREIVDGLLIHAVPADRVAITCVDTDGRSVDYARALIRRECPRYLPSFRFQIGNALRFRSAGSYDLIWSAGLFDYLTARQASFLLGRLRRMSRAEGRVVIGNFADTHATRLWMEWCGEWFLNHRGTGDLAILAGDQAAGNVTLYSDPLGAINYLVLET